jgi:HEAT repeat protein
MPTARELEDARVALALKRDGIEVSSVFDLVNAKDAYPKAIPVLMKCLGEVQEPWIKEGIVRALTVKEARGIAEDTLLDEFQKIQPDEPPPKQMLKWATGNALSVVGTDKSFGRLAALVRDKRHGKAREMLAVTLGNMKNPAAVDVLIELLDDDEVAGHALMALGKLKAQKARSHIEGFLNHPKAWVRKEASKALVKLDRKPK